MKKLTEILKEAIPNFDDDFDSIESGHSEKPLSHIAHTEEEVGSALGINKMTVRRDIYSALTKVAEVMLKGMGEKITPEKVKNMIHSREFEKYVKEVMENRR